MEEAEIALGIALDILESVFLRFLFEDGCMRFFALEVVWKIFTI